MRDTPDGRSHVFGCVAATATALALVPLTESAALDSPYRHVRTQDRSIRYLLKRGFNHSPTFARLMARLEHSDVIVYVEEVPRLPGALEGRMMMLPTSHGQRYVRIQIALRGAPDDSIALLGHELQHATEVAQEIGVSSQTAARGALPADRHARRTGCLRHARRAGSRTDGPARAARLTERPRAITFMMPRKNSTSSSTRIRMMVSSMNWPREMATCSTAKR